MSAWSVLKNPAAGRATRSGRGAGVAPSPAPAGHPVADPDIAAAYKTGAPGLGQEVYLNQLLARAETLLSSESGMVACWHELSDSQILGGDCVQCIVERAASVAFVMQAGLCLNGCEIADDNALRPSGYCDGCHDYSEEL